VEFKWPVVGTTSTFEWATSQGGTQPARKDWESLETIQRGKFYAKFKMVANTTLGQPLNKAIIRKIQGSDEIWEIKDGALNLRAIVFRIGIRWFVTRIVTKPGNAQLLELAKAAAKIRDSMPRR
jgi:hypothetical protein